MKTFSTPKRFYSLDLLRGVASFSVVLAHWSFFLIPYNNQNQILASHQSVVAVLHLFSLYGGNAVDLFFCISGFVFFWLYSDNIAKSAISFKNFSILRLSRLYPLHLLTLLLVALELLNYDSITHSNFAFANNDTYHFVLNLLFASAWGAQKGLSFNGPIWSVSIEVLLYGLFFIYCLYLPKKIVNLLILSLFGHFIISKLNFDLGRGVESFFIGGCVLIIYEKISQTDVIYKFNIWLPKIALFTWLLIVILIASNTISLVHELPSFFQKILLNSMTMVVFPLTILSLTIFETTNGQFGEKLSFLGDISYSTYLLQFPLQLLIMTIWLEFKLNASRLYSLEFIAAFFLTLIALSYSSYHYFEMPTQKRLRLFLKK